MKTFFMRSRVLVPNLAAGMVRLFDRDCLPTATVCEYCPAPGISSALRTWSYLNRSLLPILAAPALSLLLSTCGGVTNCPSHPVPGRWTPREPP